MSGLRLWLCLSVSVSSETLAVSVSDLRRDCNGSSWPVEVTGEHRKAHQPGNTGGEDPSSWYPFNCSKLLDILQYLDATSSEVCTFCTHGRAILDLSLIG